MEYCEYCSEIELCCEALGIKYNWSDSNQYFDGKVLNAACRVEPPTWNSTTDQVYENTLRYCQQHCANCYINTDRVISFQSIVTADITKSWNVFTVLIFVVVFLTPLIRTCLYVFSRFSSDGRGIHPSIDRYLVIMPMFQQYLFYDAISTIALLVVYLFTIQSEISDAKMTLLGNRHAVLFAFDTFDRRKIIFCFKINFFFSRRTKKKKERVATYI